MEENQKPAPKYAIVLLDADGTLFDFDRAEERAFYRAAQTFGVPHTAGTLKRYQCINDECWRKVERAEITPAELKIQRFVRLFDELRVKVDPVAFNKVYLEQLADGSFLMPGAEEMCAALHGACKLFIATNGISEVQRRRLAASAIKPYIEDIFISEDLGVSKPAAAYFDTVLQKVSEQTGITDLHSQTILLGDSLTADMPGAKKAGLATCWYNPRRLNCPKPELCDHTIRSLEDFPAVLGLKAVRQTAAR